MLAQYDVLAWDFDETLVDCEGADTFWRFIAENPYNQQHHIVTMRSHGSQHDIFAILASLNTGLNDTHFVSVNNIPDAIYNSYKRTEGKNQDTTNHPYNHWKAVVCQSIGAKVLIDDMGGTNVSVAGCVARNIRLVHPRELLDSIDSSNPI